MPRVYCTMVERRAVQFSSSILLGVVVFTAVLYFAREVLIPISLAILLSFLLAMPVAWLQRWKVGRVTSVSVVVLIAFLVISGLGWLVTSQFLDLAKRLPQYQQTVENKLNSVGTSSGGTFERLVEMVKHVSAQLNARSKQPPRSNVTAPGGAAEQKPIPVEVHQPNPGPVQIVKDVVAPAVKPLVNAFMVVVFVIFMLLERESLRDRFIRLGGTGRIHLTTQALDEAAERVSRYLLMQLTVNVFYGLSIGTGLYFIGIPSPVLWGVLATVLRFIPYAGVWLAAASPFLLAFAVDPGWSMLAWTIGLFAAVEIITFNFVEPWLYGSSTGISAVAILVAAVFWTWLWGPIGLLLSTPLTVCLVVIGRHVPQLAFLNILLGDEPVLTPEARYYQRLLAMDEDEAIDIAENYLKDKPLVEFYENVLVPAMRQTEEDRARGVVPENRQKFIFEAMRNTVEDFADFPTPAGTERQETSLNNNPAQLADDVTVLCLPAKDEADEIAGLALGQLLRQRGIGAFSVNATASVQECLQEVKRHKPEVVCISSVPPSALRHARFLCRKLREHFPQVKVAVGLWQTDRDLSEAERSMAACMPDLVVGSLREAVERLVSLAAAAPKLPAMPVADEHEPRAPFEHPEVSEVPPEEIVDRVTRELARGFGIPTSLVSLVEIDQQFWREHGALSSDLTPKTTSNPTVIGELVLTSDDTVAINDLVKDKRFEDDAIVHERGIRFYAGTPLRAKDGHIVGILTVVDTQPRELIPEQKGFLESMAERLMNQVEEHRAVAAS